MFKWIQAVPRKCGLLHTRSIFVGVSPEGHGVGPLRRAFRVDDDLPLEPLDDSIWPKEKLKSRMKALLNCSDVQSEMLYKANKKALRVFAPKLLTDNIDLLREHGVDEKYIYEDPKVLSVQTSELRDKIKLLKEMPGVTQFTVLAPFLRLPTTAIEKMVTNARAETIEDGNRLNYVSKKTNTEVGQVVKFFASNIRVYRIAVNKFITNLNICLDHLEPADVVRHLSVLAYAPKSIRERLNALQNSPLQKIKPWMVRVPDIALGKSFEAVIEKGKQPEFKDAVTCVWFETFVIKRTETLLGCSEETAREIYSRCKGAVSQVENMELLLEKRITAEAIHKHATILNSRRVDLQQKVTYLEGLKCLRDLNDVIPLCALAVYQLKKIVHNLNNDQLESDSTNRIYYFADCTGLATDDVAAQFARRTFMFRIPRESFVDNMQLFMQHMNPEDILADLWAFKYSPAIVAERIARAKQVRGKKLMPWMVRCPDVVLEKSLLLTKENGDLLGENETIVEYFCKRLGVSREVANAIIIKVPSVRNVRITKVKKVIDYLLEELDYTPQDIALNPRILMHSLQTTKKRMEQLMALGCRPKSLIIVCKSQRQYDMFVKDWVTAKQRMEQFG